MTDQTDPIDPHVLHDAAVNDDETVVELPEATVPGDVGAAARAAAAASAAAAYGAAQASHRLDDADDQPVGAAVEGGPTDGGEGDGASEIDPELRAQLDGRTPGELLVAAEQAAAERDSHLDQLQRLQAEFDNFRRRTKLEKESAHGNGVSWLAGRLLDVLDDLDRTVEVAAGSADEGLAAGIGAVQRKLVDTLVAAGLQRVDAVDVPFDATIHEAVQQMPAEEPVDEPQVAVVLRPGYVHNDRCLRAAMVVVRQ